MDHASQSFVKTLDSESWFKPVPPSRRTHPLGNERKGVRLRSESLFGDSPDSVQFSEAARISMPHLIILRPGTVGIGIGMIRSLACHGDQFNVYTHTVTLPSQPSHRKLRMSAEPQRLDVIASGTRRRSARRPNQCQAVTNCRRQTRTGRSRTMKSTALSNSNCIEPWFAQGSPPVRSGVFLG
jgi:hypothetical protein